MGVHITFVRSCDLDEWTAEQLQIMKLSGNGNARSFFRQHGVTESQMMSEKKYKHKAATEYKRYIAKLVAETASNSQVVLPEKEGKDELWESSSGLDNLIRSMSDAALCEVSSEPDGCPEKEAHADVISATATAKGVLNVSGTQSLEANTDTSTASVSAATSNASTQKVIPRSITKKASGIIKKSSGIKKLSTTPADQRLESFESVESLILESREAKSQESPIRAIVETPAKSRVAAAFAESEETESRPIISGFSNIGSNYQPSRPTGPASTSSVPKYSNAKGISSDQFFGRDEDDEEAMRRLNRMQTASAISSDMFSSDELSDDVGSTGPRWQGVSNFFEDMQKRIG